MWSVTFGFWKSSTMSRSCTRYSPSFCFTVLRKLGMQRAWECDHPSLYHQTAWHWDALILPTLFFFFPPLAAWLLSSCFLLRYSVRLSSPLSPSSSSSTSEWRRFLFRNIPTASSLSDKGEERQVGRREKEMGKRRGRGTERSGRKWKNYKISSISYCNLQST